MNDPPSAQKVAAARNRQRTKVFVWVVSLAVFTGAGIFLWRDLTARGMWALLPIAVAALTAGMAYRQAITAKNR